MPNSNELEIELASALHAVKKAIQLCRAVQSDSLGTSGTQMKADRSPVTVADFGAQALILHHLAEAFPHDPVVAEEAADALREAAAEPVKQQVLAAVARFEPELNASRVLAAIDRGAHGGGPEGRFWTLDPIDGTKGFLRNDQYAIALALIENGRVVLGVLGCPALATQAATRGGGCILAARAGSGADLFSAAGQPLRPICVSSAKDPATAALCESVESAHSRHDWSAKVAAGLGVGQPPVRIDSQCKYATIARGDADIYLRLPTRPDYREKIWDHAAGCLIVQEAGGTVTDITGQPLDFSCGRELELNKGVVATNGLLHERVLEAISTTGQQPVDLGE